LENKKGKSATIYDVASYANTSATTVSRVLSKSVYPVREELRQRVLDATRHLEYEPNQIAKSLKSLETRDIGVIIPTILNPFYANVILGIEDEVNKNGYNLFLCNTSRDPAREINYLHSLYQKQVRGVIISSMCQSKEVLDEYLRKGMHIILLDQVVDDVECSMIGFDCRRGAHMGVESLIRHNHKRIAFISTPLTRWTRKEVFEGYKNALKDNGIPFDGQLVLAINSEKEKEDEGFEFVAGRQSARLFVENKLDATAVMALNDMMAIGFIQELYRLGKKVPADVSVMGFDDIIFASMFTPALTTIRYPAYEVGMLAAKLLLERLAHPESVPLSLNLEPKLIIRDSVRTLD
jgi:LacI family transcriptional regulator